VILLVAQPSAVASTIRAPRTSFRSVLRLVRGAFRCARSAGPRYRQMSSRLVPGSWHAFARMGIVRQAA